MYPELFSVGPITIYSYGVLLAASYLLGLWLAMRRAKQWGLDPNRVLDLGIYIIIAALIGAKLLLLVVDFDQFSGSLADLMSLARSGKQNSPRRQRYEGFFDFGKGFGLLLERKNRASIELIFLVFQKVTGLCL